MVNSRPWDTPESKLWDDGVTATVTNMVFARILSHPLVALALRASLGGYLIYMGRVYYADPLASFRGSARPLPFDPWVRQALRAVAGFCLWGGCFILGAAIATRVLDLHGTLLALALVVIASIATWLLLPKVPATGNRFRISKMRTPR